VIGRHVAEELPFMATENLLMAAVQAGGDRQFLHERIRTHSLAASERLKSGAQENDLISRLAGDSAFPTLEFSALLDPKRYVGRAPEQVSAFITDLVQPIRERYPSIRARPRDVDV
jgi:adenylosuccinate lyase